MAGMDLVPRRGAGPDVVGRLGTARGSRAHRGVRDRHHHTWWRWCWRFVTIALRSCGRGGPSRGRWRFFLVGGALRFDFHTLGNITASRSLVPDLLSLPGYGLGAAGLLGFSRARDRGRQRHFGVILDGVIAALAILAVAWVYVIDPVLFHSHTPLATRLVLTCYPAMSIFLVVVTVRIAFSSEQNRVPSYWFLLAAMTCMFVGDSLYMFADIDLISVAGRLLDLPYALAFVATGTMALHPSMRALTEPAGNRPQASSPGRIVLVAVALLVPALITLQHPSSSLQDRVALFTIIICLTVAAVLRIVQALHLAERSEANLAYQAMHDSLTGLPNRRMMHQHLTNVLQQASVDDTHVALLFLDLDRFKLVNDTLGHTHGDELLIAVARRLERARAAVRSRDPDRRGRIHGRPGPGRERVPSARPRQPAAVQPSCAVRRQRHGVLRLGQHRLGLRVG